MTQRNDEMEPQGPERGATWVVSACLLGRACRYDGESKGSEAVRRLVAEAARAGARVVPVCPEEGLGTPRPAAELRGGDGAEVLAGRARVVQIDSGTDVTEAFVAGAMRAAAAGGSRVDRALLKARSPSCGSGATHIDGQVRAGDGVFASLLRAQGVPLASEEDLKAPQ